MLPRLIARLDDYDKEREVLASKLLRSQVGYDGEKRVDYYLRKTHFNHPVKILPGVSLEITPGNFIQMDTLVIMESAIFILEIKNITGELRFLQNPPCLHRTRKNDEVDIMDCPVYQLEKNIEDFNYWLEMNGFSFKSYGVLVLPHLASKVVIPPETMPILYAKQLPHYLRKKGLGSPIMSHEQLENLIVKILSVDRPYLPIPLCEHYRIDPLTIKNGVFCNECNTKLEKRTNRTWICSVCEKRVGNPHADNLKDWFTLVKSSITVEECREFLELKNRDAAIYALKLLPLEKSGRSVATKYYFTKIKKRF